MPNYSKINVRSPYMITQTGTSAGQLIKVDLFIHQEGGSEPANETFSLSKPVPSASVLTVNFDIAPYLKSYISHTSLTPVTGLTATPAANYVYCKIVVTNPAASVSDQYVIGYNGYGYFADGYNPTLDANVMLDEGEYYMVKNQNYGALFYFQEAGLGEAWTAKYECLDGSTADVDINLTTENAHIPYIPPTHKNNGGSTLKISKDGALQKTFTFTEICEPKYTPVVCDFVNKYGVFQTIIFFKVSTNKMTMSNSQFNMMPSSVNYSTSKNISQVFNVNGIESTTVNTGFVREGYDDIIKQILLSETIRLDGKPVIIDTKSLDLQKSINKRLINYTLTFKFANNIVNNIQ